MVETQSEPSNTNILSETKILLGFYVVARICGDNMQNIQ